MKTSKEMQLKILDKMKENVKRDLPLFDGLYRVIFGSDFILDAIWENSFVEAEHGIYPETITINGVEIPKPLGLCDLEDEEYYYLPSSIEGLHEEVSGSWCNCFKPKFTYKTEEEAITASKLLFGIEVENENK